jgi:hypothetical protein
MVPWDGAGGATIVGVSLITVPTFVEVVTVRLFAEELPVPTTLLANK